MMSNSYNVKNEAQCIPELRKLLEEIIPEASFFEDFEVEYNFKKGGRKKLLLNAREIFQGDTESKLILLAIQSDKKG